MPNPLSNNGRDNEDNKFTVNSQSEVSVNTVTEIDTSASGPIEVTISGSGAGAVINGYAEQNSVAGSSTVTLLTYIVPLTKKLNLNKIHVSGENIAVYTVKIDGVKIDRVRTYWDDFNASLEFEEFQLTASQTLTIEVENFRTNSADFNGKFVGNLI